ncbi:hypothetical protein QJS10_CPB15g01319 [Acorus calamus]|uniref:Plastid division regulator MinE n=1 Tax=Acorus calamus TaxID=4465 RepID=A0AAV9D7M1_ACOCL|nr:hypothetical protein QJS10_CPB15g01341 [Acorus calamus]KAK1296764.1 hypothetical protein QJS10_CPB15g01319 [Acorus calamus]
MAICGDFRVSAAYAPYNKHPLRQSLPPSKVGFSGFAAKKTSFLESTPKWPYIELNHQEAGRHSPQCFGISRNEFSPKTVNQDAEGILLSAVNMSFFDCLSLAWRILFPSRMVRRSSNARIVKQRLKMILFSDRCAVSDEAKQKIVSNVVGALSEFVEFDSQDKVQLSVSADPDLGTVYSVIVPVRRVKPEYQENDDDYSGITGIEYKDTGHVSGTVDVTFDFFLPNENA